MESQNKFEFSIFLGKLFFFIEAFQQQEIQTL